MFYDKLITRLPPVAKQQCFPSSSSFSNAAKGGWAAACWSTVHLEVPASVNVTIPPPSANWPRDSSSAIVLSCACSIGVSVLVMIKHKIWICIVFASEPITELVIAPWVIRSIITRHEAWRNEMKTVSLKCVYVGTREIDKRSLIEQFRHAIVLLTKRQLLSLLQAEKYLKATTSIYYYD